ncbi:MAG TPA: hypothetical protein VF590_14580 [Isosphaeraceae bacterium]|jgi:hypothetical protein
MSPRRPFTVLDAILLVAATATGLSILRETHGDLWRHEVMNFRGKPVGKAVLNGIVALNWFVICFAQPWTVALLALRLRRPRPPLRRLARQPGMVAGAAVSLVLAVFAAAGALRVALGSSSSSAWADFVSDFALWVEAFVPGSAVAGAWLTLGLGRRWRPEPSWIDRAGRIVGLFWLAQILLLSVA